MTSKFLFPTLDTDGWTNSPVKVTDYMLSHFFLSDFSQTSAFPDKVHSFAQIMHKTMGDIPQTVKELTDHLTSYFTTQFYDVDVEVIAKDDPNSNNKKYLTIYLQFSDATGLVHNLSRMIEQTGNKITNIVAVNNG